MSDTAALDSATSAAPLPGERPPLKLDVAIDKVSTCQRKVRVSIPREDIARYHAECIGEMVPTAHLPGFRPGRAPKALVGSRFKTELSEQIRSKLLADAMTQVSETEKLSPISEPELDVGADRPPRRWADDVRVFDRGPPRV
jgi:trigger factor